MNLRPLHDRVIVKRLENETKTASGIVIPDNAAEKPDQGEVLAVGPGRKNDKGELIALNVKVGDRVLFGKYSGQTVKVDGDELLVNSPIGTTVARLTRGADGVTFTYGDVYLENERQYSTFNFEVADTDFLFQEFNDREAECLRTLEAGLPLPAYDSVLKCCHAFNLLDARGVISATERMAYILRVRTLAKAVCASYMEHVVGMKPAEEGEEADRS